VDGHEGLDEGLDTLFRLHALRWGSGTTFARTEAFQREFAAAAAARGWLRLWLLELDGRPAAAWLGFRYAGAECYYQAGRDPSLDQGSVGFVLLTHTVRAALENGARDYRFLRGGESYKYRFASADPGLETIAVPRGAAGGAALGAARAWRRAKSSLAGR
jgi:CelD/BcsL family acetyltransferase involved in cellulose biosynthesis